MNTEDTAQLAQLYARSSEELSAQQYVDLLCHLLAQPHASLFQLLEQQLVRANDESILLCIFQNYSFELFPALVSSFKSDPQTISQIVATMIKFGRPRELLLLIQEHWAADPLNYALNAQLIASTWPLLERLGDKRGAHLRAVTAAVQLLRAPVQYAPVHEDAPGLTVLNTAEQQRNNHVTALEDDSLKHMQHYLEHVIALMEHVIDSIHERLLPDIIASAIFSLLEVLLPFLDTIEARAAQLLLRGVSRVQDYLPLLQGAEHELALGGYVYLLLVRAAHLPREIAHRPPLVYSARYVSAVQLPHVTALLHCDSPRVRALGVRLITCLITCLAGDRVTADLDLQHFKHVTADSDIAAHPALLLARAMIDYMVRCDDQSQRTGLFQSLNALLALFNDGSQYALLTALIAHCPYPHVAAALVDQYRRTLLHVPADSQFMRHLVPNLLIWLTARDLTTERDLLNAALSLTRLSLLNPHVAQSAGLTRSHVLAELRSCVQRLDTQLVAEIRRELAQSDWEAQQQTAAQIVNQGLPALSARDLDRAQQQHIVALQMVHSLVTRVLELANEVSAD